MTRTISRTATVLTALAFGAAAALTGCSGNDNAGPTTPADLASTTTTSTAPGSGGSNSGSTPGTSPTTTACANTLSIVNAVADSTGTVKDGPLKIETAWADEGPHPDNTVDYDRQLELMFATFDVPKNPQFGYSIPVGVPEVPAGGVYLSLSLNNPAATVAAGQTYVGQTVAGKDPSAGEINSLSLYAGTERLLAGDLTVTIGKITDDEVCGTIATVTTTDLQSFVGIKGSFAATRIQKLEADE